MAEDDFERLDDSFDLEVEAVWTAYLAARNNSRWLLQYRSGRLLLNQEQQALLEEKFPQQDAIVSTPIGDDDTQPPL